MASETKKPLKGILKKPQSAPRPEPEPKSASSGRDARAIAIQHAQLLQDRKDVEAAILDNVIALLDYPLHPDHPASAPHPGDVTEIASLIRIFQPSDYDDLILERNLADDRCGYVLCPNKRRKYKGAGSYKMINKGRKDFDIVETKELEKWCSTECTKRALWIKVQLNETAAWERVGLPEIEFELYPENKKKKDDDAVKLEGEVDRRQNDGQNEPRRLATEMAKIQLEQDRRAAQDSAALALERGDGASTSLKPNRHIDVVVREKTVTTEAEAPSLDSSNGDDNIEGYKARFGIRPEGGDDSSA